MHILFALIGQVENDCDVTLCIIKQFFHFWADGGFDVEEGSLIMCKTDRLTCFISTTLYSFCKYLWDTIVAFKLSYETDIYSVHQTLLWCKHLQIIDGLSVSDWFVFKPVYCDFCNITQSVMLKLMFLLLWCVSSHLFYVGVIQFHSSSALLNFVNQKGVSASY